MNKDHLAGGILSLILAAAILASYAVIDRIEHRWTPPHGTPTAGMLPTQGEKSCIQWEQDKVGEWHLTWEKHEYTGFTQHAQLVSQGMTAVVIDPN